MYFLKVNIAIALFYLFYRLVFYNDTFWGTRRFYLAFSLLLSLAYPFISFSGWLEKQRPVQAIISNYVQLNEITVTARQATHFTMGNMLMAAYALVSLVLLVKMLVQLSSVLRWRLKGKRQLLNGIQIVAIDETITPFSFFGSIFMNPALHDEQETSQILAHENTHVRQLHSLDVLLSEMLTITCWINPAAWLLKREIRHNLEFMADNSVLRSGFDSKSYQYHLLQLSYQVPENHLINRFNVSPLKKRIIMMNQQKSKKAGILKYSLIVPLALALILSSNAQTIANKARAVLNTPKQTVESKETVIKPELQMTANLTLDPSTPAVEKKDSANDRIYEQVEKMPVFAGGEEALINYISQILRYPVKAQERGSQGKVIVQFVINKLGKVENAKIIRGVDPDLDREGLRVINSLPVWTPGEQNGKKVSVYYVLPITFKLDDTPVDKTTSDNWRKSIVVIIDGIQQPIGFDYKSIKPEDIASINVLQADNEEKRKELVAKYGVNASSGVIVITKKK